MNETAQEKFALTAESQKAIDSWVAKFPEDKKRSAVIMALRIAQNQYGHLSQEVMHSVADYLALPRAYVYEVSTFYTMYRLAPVGKYVIGVCDSISCALCGAAALTKHFEKRLGIAVGETTADGMFTLQHVECLAACCGAPAVLVNEHHYHDGMTPEKADALLDVLKDKGVA